MDILNIVLTAVILLIALPFAMGIYSAIAYIIANLFGSRNDD
jgi:hypothetical protein